MSKDTNKLDNSEKSLYFDSIFKFNELININRALEAFLTNDIVNQVEYLGIPDDAVKALLNFKMDLVKALTLYIQYPEPANSPVLILKQIGNKEIEE